jgi:hypothetical protein
VEQLLHAFAGLLSQAEQIGFSPGRRITRPLVWQRWHAPVIMKEEEHASHTYTPLPIFS